MDPELQRGLKRLVNIGITVLGLVAIYLLFAYILPIFGNFLVRIPNLIMPFILAFLIAILVEPVVRFFEGRLKLKRSLSVLFSLILVTGIFIYAVSTIFSVIINDLNSIYHTAISHSDQLIAKVMGSVTDIQLFFIRLDIPTQMQSTIQDALQRAMVLLQDLTNNLINSLVGFFTALPGLFILLLIATVATYFVMKDRALLRGFVYDMLPDRAKNMSKGLIAELIRALTGFLKAYSILISITAIITLISLKILGLNYILTIAIIVGLTDILPVLGPGLIFVPWIIWQFISGHSGMGISLLVVYLLVTAVRQFLEPKIVGDNIGLHPLVTLISLYVGLQLGGIVGMILGPVCVVIFIASYRAGVFEKYDWRNKN